MGPSTATQRVARRINIGGQQAPPPPAPAEAPWLGTKRSRPSARLDPADAAGHGGGNRGANPAPPPPRLRPTLPPPGAAPPPRPRPGPPTPPAPPRPHPA